MRPEQRRPTAAQFRRRRIAALVVVFLTCFALIKVGVSLWDKISGAPAKQASTSQPTNTKTQTSKPVKVKACNDSDIKVSLSIDGGPEYAMSGVLTINSTFTNTSTSACLRDIGATANEILVQTPTGAIKWSTDRCPANSKVNLVTMNPRDVYRVTISWEGNRNPAKCGEVAPHLPAGDYTVISRNSGAQSEPATITFR